MTEAVEGVVEERAVKKFPLLNILKVENDKIKLQRCNVFANKEVVISGEFGDLFALQEKEELIY